MIESEEAGRRYVADRCDDETLLTLEKYVTALKAENQRQNLVSAASLDSVWSRHIADSAQLLNFVPRGTLPVLDLGSGPGLPGLVIAAMRPDQTVVLVESRRKRVEFLQEMVALLELRNCRVEGRRLEQVGAFPAGAITARAFAPLGRLLELSERFSTADTLWVLPKGRSAAQELADMPTAQQSLFHVEQSITDPAAGIIVGKLPFRGIRK